MKQTFWYDDKVYTALAMVETDCVLFTVWESQFQDDSSEAFLTGHVKVDGCSDWNFKQTLHLCGVRETHSFGDLLHGLYLWAAELLPDYKQDILWEPGQ